MCIVNKIDEINHRLDRLESKNNPLPERAMSPEERMRIMEIDIAEIKQAVFGNQRDKSNTGIRLYIDEQIKK